GFRDRSAYLCGLLLPLLTGRNNLNVVLGNSRRISRRGQTLRGGRRGTPARWLNWGAIVAHCCRSADRNRLPGTLCGCSFEGGPTRFGAGGQRRLNGRSRPRQVFFVQTIVCFRCLLLRRNICFYLFLALRRLGIGRRSFVRFLGRAQGSTNGIIG